MRRINRLFSIKFTVVTIVIIATTITAAIAIGAQYYFSRVITSEQTQTLFNLTAQNTSNFLTNLEQRSAHTLKVLAAHAPILDNDDISKDIDQVFAEILNVQNVFYSLHLSEQNGVFHQLVNLNASPSIRKQYNASTKDRWVIVDVRGEGEDRTKTFTYVDESFNVRTTREMQSEFYPQSRVWFTNATTDSVYQTDPYLFEHLQSPGQSYAIKLKDHDAVLGIDVALFTLASYLQEQDLSDSTRLESEIYVYQKNGNINASNQVFNHSTRLPTVNPMSLTAEEQSYIRSLPQVQVANELDWAPIDYTISGVPQGYSVDVIKLIGAMTGIQFEFVNGFTWKQLIRQYQNDKIDILTSIFQSSGMDHGDYSKSYLDVPFSIITQPQEETYTSINSLSNKRVAILNGWSIIPALTHHFPTMDLYEYDTLYAVIEAVENGDVDAAIDVGVVLEHNVEKYFVKNIQFHSSIDMKPLDVSTNLYMSVKENEDAMLLQILDKAIAHIDDRQRRFLANKWFSLNDEDSKGLKTGVVPYEFLVDIAEAGGTNNQLETIMVDHVPTFVYIEPIDEAGETFFSIIVPAEKVFAPIIKKVTVSMGVTILCVLFTLPISWLLARPIVNPVKKLELETDKIKNRQYDDVNVVDTSILELDKLAHSLYGMSGSIQQYEKELKELMDGIIQQVAQAIDAKSPYTAGHCRRVPELGLMLASAAEKSDDAPFAEFKFANEDEYREFYTAAWLHDCGKLTIPEHIVDKGSKLETIYNRIHEVRMRFEVLRRDAEIDYLKALQADPSKADELKASLEQRFVQLQEDFAFIANTNVGGEFLEEEAIKRIEALAEQTWTRHFDDTLGLSPVEELNLPNLKTNLPAEEKLLANKPQHIIERQAPMELDPKLGIKMDIPEHLYNLGEIYNLSISRGTLTTEDRFKINEHMISTIKMLEGLPFPKELSRVPKYATTHHETLKGTGYPRKLTAEDLSTPERLLVLADIYEALTASDRPYKKAKTISESIKILSFMVKDDHVDGDVFKLFLTSGVYKEYAEKYLKPEQIDDVDINQYL
ncbi:HD domain-containing phosphohydrolase [Thalassotalea agarivorans]|uniref:HD-GYP domain, c-di-GMP phosphodiesterase class II (Or its inactivated variant) n=1 Tax=Thalassotalea agarivorans TaxID=349064 RepID=A0A1I0B2U3_THASX|nr:HD domain-containing phosphohydrolase [Thalassotalea agarivorans]SET00664.1 HD-GYP domain, c-di-GMP phosphodiesterase class II (or its inactivated variant) [Thalassotalea agarivorans]